MSRTPACVWIISAELLLALDTRFGEPTDAYLNGSQVWLRDDGPGDIGLEWRLHPVGGYVKPTGVDHHELLEVVLFDLRAGEPRFDITKLWDGLEAFPAWDDETEPAPLALACSAALGMEPTAFGTVDHTPIGDTWEAAGGRLSVIGALLDQLRGLS